MKKLKEFFANYKEHGLNSKQAAIVIGIVMALFFIVAYANKK